MEPKGYEQWYGNWTYVLVATLFFGVFTRTRDGSFLLILIPEFLLGSCPYIFLYLEEF
jgi:hypothetical protein